MVRRAGRRERPSRDSSLAFRLNLGFFLRLLVIFVAMDLLLALLIAFGGVLLSALSVPFTALIFLFLAAQALILLGTLLFGERGVQRILRPIQDLGAAAVRLSASSHMSRRDLRDLASELERIGVDHLDSRVDVKAEQKELQQLAQAINDMLDRVDRAYSAQLRFVSDASHELRTPIAVIQGYASLLDRWGKTNPEVLQESIDAIRSESEAMQRLVEQLLFLARGDNDSQPFHPAPLDLTALAGEVLREEEMICPDRVFLPRWSMDPVPVLADADLIKQLLRILLDNAGKYSPPEGRIWLRISRDRDWARVAVQDEGMGISPESLPHIFDRFYRADSSRTRSTGGTGLGLAIAKWIVDRHDGWFEVYSVEGVGSRITFVLPLTREAGPEGEEKIPA